MDAPEEVPVEEFKDDAQGPFPEYIAWIVLGFGVLVTVTCIVAASGGLQ